MNTVVPGAPSPRPSIGMRADALVLSRPESQTERSRSLELRFGLSLISTFCVSTAVVLTCWVVLPALLLSWNAAAVQSGSMEPSIERGDVVVFHPASDSTLALNTVIQFQPIGAEPPIVHRVVGYDEATGAYITQGDANATVDSDLVPHEQVDGVGALLVPLIGHPLLWLQERNFVFLLLTVLGGALVLMSSQASSGGLVSERGPQVRGALTSANTLVEAESASIASLFPVELSSRLIGEDRP